MQFDSALVEATVLKQYTKTKETKKGKLRTYQVLKLCAKSGFSFYTTANQELPNILNQQIRLEIFPKKITFYHYITSFYSYSKILYIYKIKTLKQKLNQHISSLHVEDNITNIYQALYTATPLNRELQSTFSKLGVSHLLAISGFHLGVLSALLFFLVKYPYKVLQNRYFPYRNSKFDIFIFVAFILLFYLLFLDSPPSLLRAFIMLIIGFFLYDRGIKIISMQTLFLTLILLLAFFPRLFFALGFWLSIMGVFYIFLFLIHFKNLHKIWQFILIPIWIYILMLPYSLAIFGNFSIYHPLSIIWTTLFTLFYPLSILLHIVGYGDMFDSLLKMLIDLPKEALYIKLEYPYLLLEIVLSLLAIYKREATYLLLSYTIVIFIYVYYIALNTTNFASSSLSVTI